jgi:hypothetical protein
MKFNPLPKLMAMLTRHPRYIPDIKWSGGSLVTHDIFRFYEVVFGRRFGIRAESKLETGFDREGKYFIKRSFYTTEALLAHTETLIRAYLKRGVKRVTDIDRKLQYAVVNLFGKELVFNAANNPIGYRFAVAYDNKSTVQIVSGTTQTYSFTTSGSDRLIMGLGLCVGDDMTGLTYAGVTVPALADVKNGTDNRLYTYSLAGPASGANNAVWSQTTTGFFVTAVQSYSGVDQTTPTGTAATNTDASADTGFSASITTTASGSWIAAFIRDNTGSSTFTAGAATTVRVDNVGNGLHSCDSGASVSIGSNTLAATYNTSVQEAWVIVEIFVAGAAATFTPRIMQY